MNTDIGISLDKQHTVADSMSKVAQSLNSKDQITLTKEDVEKLAEYLLESGKAVKCAVSIARDLLKDAEDMSGKLDKIEKEAHQKEREDKICKIASMLKSNGLISKTAMAGKISELETMSDDFLSDFQNTLSGLSENNLEKNASDGTVETFAFMDKSLYDVKEQDNKSTPRPIDF